MAGKRPAQDTNARVGAYVLSLFTQNTSGRASAIDERTTRHSGYAVSHVISKSGISDEHHVGLRRRTTPMSLKQTARHWMPPALVSPLLGALDYVRTPQWEYMPDGWETRDPRITNWNVSSIAETQKRKWPAFAAALRGSGTLGINHEAPVDAGTEDLFAHNLVMSYGYVLALAARNKERLALLDWGGGIGHYCLLSHALLPGVEIDYHCQDVPLLCDVGREVLPDATFHDEPDTCFRRVYDLVVAGSSLWYAPDWRAMAAKLVAASTDYLYVTRMVFVRQAPSFVVVQRPRAVGYQTEYLAWILNRDELVKHVSGCGMTLVREFLIGKGPRLHKAPEQGDFRGFLFRKNR